MSARQVSSDDTEMKLQMRTRRRRRRQERACKPSSKVSQATSSDSETSTAPELARIRATRATSKRMLAPCVPLLLALPLLAIVQQAGGAVVRPTIFSDATQVSSSQQQQQQQPHAQSIYPLIPQATAENASQMPAATKINPLGSRFCQALNGAKLDAPLGLQSRAVDDLALSASSYNNEQVGPHLARLNLDISGGAWCPVNPISSSNFGKEWIQVKLNRSYVVSALETQGRGQGNGKEFVPNYQIEYSRNGGHTWHKWKDFRGSSLLRANEDSHSAVKNELSPPIVGANVIRILPYSQHLRTVCLRFELHGCPYDEGAPIAYSMNDGVVEHRWGHLIDYTYDGLRQRERLSQGLGQLVDGVKGPDNFSQNHGFEWVGWKSMNGDVVIEFTFKTVRNFTGALFHSNNLFSQGVEVFQSVDVHYGLEPALALDALRDAQREQARRDAAAALLRHRRQPQQQQQQADPLLPLDAAYQSAETGSGTLWSQDVLSIEYEPDKSAQSSRPVTVHLKQRLANKLRFHLKFASKWILISEVEFLSHPVDLLALPQVAALNQQQPTAGVQSRASETHQQQALMQALASAKSYDEFVAIVREHQLRRIATNAFLASVVGDTTSVQPSMADSITGYSTDAPASSTADSATRSGSDMMMMMKPEVWQDNLPPPLSANPSLQDLLFPLGAPIGTNFLAGNVQSSPPPPADQPQPPQVPRNGLSSMSDTRNMADNSAASDAGSTGGGRIGLASLTGFILVAVLVLLAALFVVSSHRMRHNQSKMAHVGSLHPRHLSSGGGGKSVGLGPNLHSFISALSPTSQQQQQQQQHLYNTTADSLYNQAIFANQQAQATLQQQQQGARGSSIKRAAGQLLVSVKEPGKMLFGSSHQHQQHHHTGSKRAKHQQQGVSTQLIVGLNQANPFAQQQVYSGQAGQQLANYGANNAYSGISSMASSSTTTGVQGDYAEYAIPDAAQPMIPARHQPQLNTFGNATTAGLHLNQAFNPSSQQQQLMQHSWTTTANPSKPFGFQSELRASSHRAPIQPQVVQHRQPQIEHNYELVQQQQQPEPQTGSRQQQQQQQQLQFHQRTLSGGCQANSQPAFNSFTLGRPGASLLPPQPAGRHQQRSAGGQVIVNPAATTAAAMDECSPGAGSSASGATTATTSADSSEMSHYYYSTDRR